MAGFKEFAHEIRKRDSDYPAATTNHIAMYAKDNNRVYIIDEYGHLSDFEAYDIYGYTLSTSADARIGGDISVTGDSFLNKNAYITLDTLIGGNVSITGNAFIHKKAYIASDTFIGGGTSITGDTFLNKNAYITSDTYIGGNISVSGDSFFNKNTYINGVLSVNGDTFLNKNAFIGGNVSITGDAFIGKNEYVAGNAFISKNVSISGNTTVYGYVSAPKGTNTTTQGNEGFGIGALASASTATFNTSVGVSASSNVTTGTQGVALGYGAASNSRADMGAYVAIGYLSMSNYNGSTATGYSGNVAIGAFSMQYTGGLYTFYTGTGPVTIDARGGAFGTACGFNSGQWHSGINNTYYGQSSGKFNIGGANNVAIGRQAMEGLSANDLSGSSYPITNSSSNIGIGLAALRRTYSASGNVAIGFGSMTSVSYNPSANQFASFTGNVAVGNATLTKINTGSNNVSIGTNSGNNLDSGNYNVFIGTNAGVSEISGSNKLYIHSSASLVSTSGSALIYGDFTTGELYNNGNRILTSTNYGPLTVNDKCYVDAAISGNLAFGVQTPIVYSTVYKDTHNALNTSTGIFIAPFTGYYTLTGSLNTVTTGLEADITVDGTLKYTAFGSLTTRGSGVRIAQTLYLTTGQQLLLKAAGPAAPTGNISGGVYINNLQIFGRKE